ncbi:bifunctional lysylphosphatidylglycerol flippase/synthetase MprF [Sphingobacterium spiritivorum]|uniref:bifunctional lysylphosphatidylglycerol flippase/synthetase MprF n=1 Tax=Sphingobacterium spiritivorum TaxID=258 RepID=UPI003DA55F9F
MNALLKEKIRSFSPKTYWKEIVAIFVILLAFFFFRSERKELASILPQLQQADPAWLIGGVCITILYILLQGWMYIQSFRTIGASLHLSDAIELFLKRNFLSVFLPAGGISSLAYTTAQLRRRKLKATQIHQAGAIYGYVSLLTVFIIGVPVIIYTVWDHRNFNDAWLALLALGLLLGIAFAVFWSFRTKGKLYGLVERRFPKVIHQIDEVFSGSLDRKHLLYTVFISTLIECCGILHAFVSMYALGVHISFEAAAVGYTISVVLMIISPFLRGLGAVEFTMLYIFTAYGYAHDQALGITLLYRVFEFWLPLFAGIVSFLWRGKQLIVRILPAVSIFFLGLVNLISVATPPLAERMRLEKFYLPAEAMHASKLMVLVMGIALMVTSAYLLKGLRLAWVAAIIFTVLSLFGHLGKAFDYEESIVALLILFLLMSNRRQYNIKTNLNWIRIGFITFFTVLAAVGLFEFLSFYFIDKKHFGEDFSWQESLYHTIRSFLLFSDDELDPRTNFGRDFLNITRLLGLCSWLLLLYTILRPKIVHPEKIQEGHELGRAKNLLQLYGHSPMDYFKVSADKQIYFSTLTDGFVSYATASEFAIVLDEPVCEEEDKEEVIAEFEEYCHGLGLKTAYYRVDESSLVYFMDMKKQKIVIGQEAIMETRSFSLSGKDRKSLRNGLNALTKKGYSAEVLYAPHSSDLVEELQAVSHEWLESFGKREMIFSQGMFEAETIQYQDVIVVRDEEKKIQAFLNIIPDYAPEECTYDLIRKRAEAPGGCMDALIVELIGYAQQKNLNYLNLGMIPMSGLSNPDNPAEQIMKFASEKVGSFKHYQTLRSFKEKYATIWENKYLVFSNDFDLLQLPVALTKVMKPGK